MDIFCFTSSCETKIYIYFNSTSSCELEYMYILTLQALASRNIDIF